MDYLPLPYADAGFKSRTIYGGKFKSSTSSSESNATLAFSICCTANAMDSTVLASLPQLSLGLLSVFPEPASAVAV